MQTELPIHQILDLMIFLGRSMVYFRDAYRMPLFYNPENPTVERVGLQGDAMAIEVCVENPDINQDIVAFYDSLNEMGDWTAERLRTLGRIMEELDY